VCNFGLKKMNIFNILVFLFVISGNIFCDPADPVRSGSRSGFRFRFFPGKNPGIFQELNQKENQSSQTTFNCN